MHQMQWHFWNQGDSLHAEAINLPWQNGGEWEESWPQLLCIPENSVQLPACKATLHLQLVKICKLFDVLVVRRKRDAKNDWWRAR